MAMLWPTGIWKTVYKPFPRHCRRLISVMEEMQHTAPPHPVGSDESQEKTGSYLECGSRFGLVQPPTCWQKAALEKVQAEGVVVHRKQQLLQGDDLAALSNELVDLLLADHVIEGGSLMSGILVFSEKQQVVRELLGKARQVADEKGITVAALYLGESVPEDLAELGAWGADTVYTVANPLLAGLNPETYTDALAGVIAEVKPDLVLVGATKPGLEISARAAARLGAGCRFFLR